MSLSENKPEMSNSEVKVRKKYESEWETLFGLERHVWTAMFLAQSHFLGLHGLLMMILGQVPRTVFLHTILWASFGMAFGATGVHRYWSHRTFKAKLPLQICMAFFQTLSGQYPIFKWCRDHRIHHKFVETDADPHDTRRGFWFTHVGWIITKEHPAVKEKEATIDLSDLDNDPIVRFQSRYYFRLLFLCHLVPLYSLHAIWPSMSLYQIVCVNYLWVDITIQSAMMVNSFAHRWGYQPYDKTFNSTDNSWVNILTFGEGWHNYHHTFPWDYKSTEWGFYSKSWSLLDFLAWTGQAYDLKTVNRELVIERAKRTGDGSFPLPQNAHSEESHGHRRGIPEWDTSSVGRGKSVHSWGWGDDDMGTQDFQVTECLSKRSE